LSQTPLGEFTTVPQTSQLDLRGSTYKEREGKERTGRMRDEEKAGDSWTVGERGRREGRGRKRSG